MERQLFTEDFFRQKYPEWYFLENDRLLVKVKGGRGTNLTEFVDKKTGRNWIWSTEKSSGDQDSLDLEASFSDSTSRGGVQEIFPNERCEDIKGYQLVDHGELWRRSWNPKDEFHDEISFTLNCETYPIKVTKSFRLTDHRLLLSYTFESRSLLELPVLFKLRQFLSVERGEIYQCEPGECFIISESGERLLGLTYPLEWTLSHMGLGDHLVIELSNRKTSSLRSKGLVMREDSLGPLETRTQTFELRLMDSEGIH